MIEGRGIPCVSISIMRKFTEEIKPSRAIFLKWPLGHPLGEPFKDKQHNAVLREAFNALKTIKEPGTIIDVPFRWKRDEDWKG